MDRSDVIKLISQTKTQDAYGVWRMTETSNEVFCNVQSVTRSEFFQGGRNGLNPDLVFTVFFDDYNDESIIEYDGKRYGIYRTYRAKTDVLELYAERKGGTNEAPSTASSTASTMSGELSNGIG